MVNVCTADELCKTDKGALLESLHMGPLKSCYATGSLTLYSVASNVYMIDYV